MSTRKVCAYKNCKSDSSDPNCMETFFAFPRDEHRCEIWVELSCCFDDNSKNFKQKLTRYLCSKHFDHKKYIAFNSRRKLLLSTAIPFPYESDDDDDNKDEYIGVEFEEIPELSVDNDTDSRNYQNNHDGDDDNICSEDEVEVLESTWQDEIPNIDNTNENSLHVEKKEIETNKKQEIVTECDYKNQQNRVKKRKIKDDYIESNKKIDKISTDDVSRESLKDNENYHNTDDCSQHIQTINNDNDDDKLITHPEIKTLLVENEEYIKMPKLLYCQEKRQLLNEIQYYKNIILDFKKKLLDVKL